VDYDENKAIVTVQKDNNSEKNINNESNSEKQESERQENTDNANGEGKRKHKKYRLSINHLELKSLEGTTINGFVDLATAVILIDGKPYDKRYLPLSKERKNDFKRYIEHFAVIDTLGKRKFHIKRVYSIEQREELNELQANIQRNNSKK